MSLSVEDENMYKGQNKDINIYVTGPSGKIDITGFTITFNVKATISGTPVITKTTAEITEINITDAANGVAELYLVPSDTTSLDAGKYYYDVWTTDLNSKVRPIVAGYFWIHEVAPTMVSEIRGMLDEAGELRRQPVKDALVYPSTTTKVYLPRTRILSVEGVYLLADDDHSGINYYGTGGFDKNTGVVWLSTPLPTANNMVRVDYTWESGINNDVITRHLTSSRMFTVMYTGISFTYGNAVSDLQHGAEAMSVSGAIIACILTANGANVAQMGYNFRLDEFEIQTKLWGEGMIAEALFNVYIHEYDKWRQALGKAGTILLATPDIEKYDIETLVGYTDSSSEGGEGF